MIRFFVILIAVFFLYWLVRVLLALGRLFWNAYKIQRFMRDPIGETQKRARKAYARQQADYERNHPQEPPHKKKKIDRDVGEYIAFTDIEVSETSTDPADGSTTTTVYHEQQVTDIEWEDIKE